MTRRLWRSPALILSLLVLAVIAAWAIAPTAFAPYSPTVGVTADRFHSPSLTHLFGTDQLGRDVFSRVVHGTRLSVQAAVTAVLIAIVTGATLGLVAAYAGGWIDVVISRFIDVMLSIPGLLLSLTIVTVLGFGTGNVALAVGVVSIPPFARLVRAEARRIRTSTYVEAARGLGRSHLHIAARHVLPNSSAPVLALAALELGTAALAVAALSFLGFGATPPDPEWGSMIAEGRSYVSSHWWLTALPGLVLALFVIASHRLSRELQPRKGGSR